MQTLRFTRALTVIVAELKVEKIIEFLKPYALRGSNIGVDETVKDTFTSLFIESQIGYTRLREDSNNAKIMDAVGLNGVYTAQRFGRLVRLLGNLGQSQQTFNAPDVFVEFYSLYVVLSSLVTLKETCRNLLEAERIPLSPPGNGLLELRLLDYDGTGIENGRVQQFFESLTELHAMLSQFLNVTGSQLKVAYVDSGSDLVVGLQCAKALVDIMRGLFSEFWERIKFQAFEDFERKIDALSKGLSFVGEVKVQVDNQAISEADGRVLTHRVLAEMTTLVGIGASLPQDEAIEKVDNRKLLTEKRGIKLLGQGSS